MPEPTFAYRVWQRGSEWHWQVLVLDGKTVVASGAAKTSVAARTSAMRYCLTQQDDHSEP